MKTTLVCFTAFLFFSFSLPAAPEPIANRLIDYAGFLRNAAEVGKLREQLGPLLDIKDSKLVFEGSLR